MTCQDIKIKYMTTNATEWLNNNFTTEQKENLKVLFIAPQERQNNQIHQRLYTDIPKNQRYYLTSPLIGNLDCSTLPNLEKLIVEHQLITHLNLTNCCHIQEVNTSYNRLEEIIWPTQAPNLTAIYLTNNNLRSQDLSCFSPFTNLEKLFIGMDREKTHLGSPNQSTYNHWTGSLIHLRDCQKLQELDISGSDIDSGLSYLPTKELITFVCANRGRKEAGINNFKKILKWNEKIAASEDLEINLAKVNDITNYQGEIVNQIIQSPLFFKVNR